MSYPKPSNTETLQYMTLLIFKRYTQHEKSKSTNELLRLCKGYYYSVRAVG